MATAGHKGAPKTKVRRKEKKNVVAGQAHIKSTFNNTIIAITDPSGAVISWASAGTVGFKGSVSPPRSPLRWPLRLLDVAPWSMA